AARESKHRLGEALVGTFVRLERLVGFLGDRERFRHHYVYTVRVRVDNDVGRTAGDRIAWWSVFVHIYTTTKDLFRITSIIDCNGLPIRLSESVPSFVRPNSTIDAGSDPFSTPTSGSHRDGRGTSRTQRQSRLRRMTDNTTADEPDESGNDRNDNPTIRLGERITRLETTDPAADFGDLEPVGDTLADARVIGLGEATHGTREFFRLKHRLVRYLVEKQGLRLFAIEANFPETLTMNEYVLDGEGTPEEALDGMYFWTWNTESIVAFAEWLREFNEERPLDDRVRFHGIDAQYTAGAVERLDTFLAEVDPDLHEAVAQDLSAADDEGETTDEPMSAHDPDATDRLVERLTSAFDGRAATYAAATDERTTALARRCLDTIEQARARRVASETEGQTAAMAIRDAAMADNVGWLLDHAAHD